MLWRSDTDVACPSCDHEFMDWCEQDEQQFDDHMPWEFYECPKCRMQLDENEDIIDYGGGEW